MIHSITKTLLLLASAGTLAAGGAGAQILTYTQGDFLVGFRQVGSTNSVVVDIGPITDFATPQAFALNIGSTLAAQYGAGWASDPNVSFSLISTDSADNTSFVSSATYFNGPNAGPAKVWTRLTNTTSNIFQGKVNTFGSEFTSRGQVEPKADANAYANYMPGGTTDTGHVTAANISWGYFNPTSEGNFSQTTPNVSLDLIRLVPGSGAGTDLGTFHLSADGNTLSFVPEPSTWAATALGALALLGFQAKRTRKALAANPSA